MEEEQDYKEATHHIKMGKIDFMAGMPEKQEIEEKNALQEAPGSKKFNWAILGVSFLLAVLIVGIFIGVSFIGNQPIEITEADVRLDVLDSPTQLQKVLTDPFYKNKDLDAYFEDKETRERVLDFNLRSHPSVDYIKQVGLGNQVVMWYDINSQYGLFQALGKPDFIDMRTGQIVERDWKYVYWVIEEKQRQVCVKEESVITKNGTQIECIEWVTEDYEVGKWLPYNSHDIPKGQIRIGIEVETKQGDYIDGIWNVGGKRLDRHASWTADLETSLIAWWKMDETSGATAHDSTGNYGGINGQVELGRVGKIETAYGFGGNTSSYINTTYQGSLADFTIGFWTNVTSNIADTSTFFGSEHAIGGGHSINIERDANQGYVHFWTRNDDGGGDIYSTTNLTNQGYIFVVAMRNGNNHSIWINGVVENYTTSISTNIVLKTPFFMGSRNRLGTGARNPINARIDEFFIYNRFLTNAEITQLYNDGNGLTYLGESNIILLSPANNTNFTTSTNNFIWNVSDPGSLGITNTTIFVYNSTDLVYNFTNSSGIAGNYTINITLFDGDYFWNVTAYDGSDVEYSSSTRTFTINLVKPTVTLWLPANATESNREDWDLISNLTVGNYTINNATTYLWFSNGTLFNSITNATISGTSDVILNETLEDLPFGFTYLWNVQINYENPTLSTFGSVFANNNFTFTRLPFEVTGENFNTTSFETDSQTFFINVSTINDILSTSINLNYDGNIYFTETNCVAGFCGLEQTIDIPLITDGNTTQNKTFFWELTLFGLDGSVFNFNTSSNQQNITRIFLSSGVASATNKSLNFTTWRESNRTDLRPMSFQSTFNFWLGSGSVKRTNSFNVASADNVNLTINPTNRTFFINAFIEYDAVGEHNETYRKRNYHLQGASITNTTQNIRLFLLEESDSTSFIQRVVDTSQIAQIGVLILQQRYYPEDDTFETVSITKTNNEGQSVGFYKTEIPDYRHTITRNGTVLKVTERGKIFPESSPFILIFTLGEILENPWTPFEPIPNIVSSLTFNQTTGIVKYEWIDSTGALSIANLTVNQVRPNQSNVNVCSISSTLTAGILTCNVSGLEGTFLASGYIGRSPSVLDKLITFTISSIKFILAKPFLLLWIIVLLGVVGMSLFFPPAGIILTTAVIVIGMLMGIVGVSWLFVWAIIAIAIWIFIET